MPEALPVRTDLNITNDIIDNRKGAYSMTTDNTFRARLRYARQKWHLTQTDLAVKAGIGVATVRRAENAYYEPRLDTARKLANALQVRLEWLLTGDEPMLWMVQMTAEEQQKQHTGPGTEGLPGYVIADTGPWFTDDAGEWHIDTSFPLEGPIT
jgi:DNA-binding XRE family transcriptional regulator